MGRRSVADWIVVIAGAAFALLAVSVPAAADGPNTWALDSNILVFNKTVGVSILSDQHSPDGGSVRIKLDGSVLGNYCGGGFEEMQFDWHFTRDIHQLSDGDIVPASVEAKKLTVQPPCNGDLAILSGIWIGPGDAPIPDDLQAQVDSDRIYSKVDQVHAWAGQDPHAASDKAYVGDGPAKKDGPLAYMGVNISFRGGGDLWYVYLYRRVDQSTPTSGAAVSTELHIDRRGGDYAHFPSADPQACSTACSVDKKCLAYTFVQPTGGNPALCWLKSSIPPAIPSDCCVSGIRTLPPPASSTLTVEDAFDRKGSDYTQYDLPNADPGLCLENCRADGRCLAYTYTRPGARGPLPRCYLKSAVPPPTADQCCVSGVRQ